MKMQPGAYRAAVSLAVAAILGGCSGSSIGSIPAAGTAGPAASTAERASSQLAGKHRGKQKVALRIKIPRAPRHTHGRQLRPYFVATSTLGIEIQVYAHGAHVTPLATTKVGVGPSSPLCTPVAGGRTCTVPAESPVGNDDFVVTSYDAQPVSGSFGSAKQLAIGSTTFAVVKGQLNSIGVTLGGVVATGVVGLTTASIPAIDNNSQTVTISAQDADGNVLVTDGWFSASGDPVTMSLDTTVGPSVASFFKFTPSTVSFASPTSVMAYTASGASPTQIQNGFTGVVWANPSNGGTSGAANLTVAKPAFTEYTATSNYLEGITVGPDNALWFIENSANKIGRITTAGSITSEFSTGITASAGLTSISTGQDGNLWFTEMELGKVASVTTSGTVVEYLTPGGANDLPSGIVAGPDGNMWFTESSNAVSKIGKFSATAMDNNVGLIHDFTTNTANSGPNQIAVGPDNKLWFTECLVDKIGNITTAGTGAADYALVSNSIGQGGITAGSDGAMWFAEENPNSGHSIGRIPTSGSPITLPATFANTFTSPLVIVTGPDGAIWFTENGNNKIGRISPTDPTHTVVEFTVPTNNANPYGIVKGPDGALWFTECLSGKIAKLQ